MSLRICSEPGCPELVKAGRCTTHARVQDSARGRRQQRGYDREHDRIRAEWQRNIYAGLVVRCWRCGTQVHGRAWDLGHDDHDRSLYRGPECVRCNRGTAGRR